MSDANYNGSDRQGSGVGCLDITVKSATTFMGRMLAPTWALVRGIKKWQAEQAGLPVPAWTAEYNALSEEQYAEQYVNILRQRYIKHSERWHEYLRAHDEIVLLCYCKDGEFCHRHLAAEVLNKVAKHIGV